jgi:DNA-binding XRE family transcriptional regulator
MKYEIKNADDFLAVLESEREDADMSQHNLALQAGMTHASYWNWSRAGFMPKLETALNYAKALGLKVYIGK